MCVPICVRAHSLMYVRRWENAAVHRRNHTVYEFECIRRRFTPLLWQFDFDVRAHFLAFLFFFCFVVVFSHSRCAFPIAGFDHALAHSSNAECRVQMMAFCTHCEKGGKKSKTTFRTIEKCSACSRRIVLLMFGSDL